MNKTIAIDIDDVLADSTESIRQMVNKQTGLNLSREDYLKKGEYWGYYERVWIEHGLIDKVSFNDFEQEMEIDQSHVPLLPSAAFAIQELSRNYHVILVTARNIEWKEATRKWLDRHFDSDNIEVYYTGHRHSRDYRSKGGLCRELGVSLMIDDNPGHCQSVKDEGIDAILFGEYGWHFDLPEDLVRCKDWPAVLGYIDANG